MSFFAKLLTFLRALFVRNADAEVLAKLDPQAIRRNRVLIEKAESELTKKIEDNEQKKARLFRQGVEGGSERQKLQLARKIKELDQEISTLDRQLALISNNLRVLNGIAQLKENERLLRDLGMESLVGKLDLNQLQSYVEEATIEGQFHKERFAKLVGALDEADAAYQVTNEEQETLKILEAMQQAAQAGTEASMTQAISKISPVRHPEPIQYEGY